MFRSFLKAAIILASFIFIAFIARYKFSHGWHIWQAGDAGGGRVCLIELAKRRSAFFGGLLGVLFAAGASGQEDGNGGESGKKACFDHHGIA
mgnify:CR=1 FL=1